METCLKVDHVALLRPRFEDPERAKAIVEALRHLGKPYDFEFDFNQGQRIVCTGLIYRTVWRLSTCGRYKAECGRAVTFARSRPRPCARHRC